MIDEAFAAVERKTVAIVPSDAVSCDEMAYVQPAHLPCPIARP